MKHFVRTGFVPVAAAVLAMSMITACGSSGTQEASPSASTGSSAASSQAPKEPVKASFWTPLNPNAMAVVKNMGELPMIQEWEKKTNVKFTFQHPSGSSTPDVVQQYGVMIASNNLPDAMLWNWNNVQGGTSKMFNDGTIIKLNELIDKHAPNLKKILNDNPQVAKQIKADNGDIYTLPHLRVGQHGQYKTFSGLIIRQDWLDELGLKQPETVAEWETVLKAFKEKKNALPFTSNKNNPLAQFDIAGAYGVSNSFYLNNGKVVFGPAQPAFKDYLTTMQRWYKEGLIDPDFASNDSKTMDAKVSSGKAGAFFGYIGGSIGTLLPALQKTEPKANLVAAQYPVLNKGEEPKFVQASWEYDNVGTVITKSNKNPAEIVKALDYLYSEEGALLKNFGIEGQTYKMVNGQPQYTDLILKNPDSLPLGQAMAKYFIANYSFTGVDDDRYNDQYYQLPQQKDAVKTFTKYAKNAYSVIMPPVSLTTEEAKESSKILTEVNTYLNEQLTKMVMGAEKVESYGKVIDQIKKMNIDRAVEIQQAAVDRYNKR
jgi:putative aldouronate transport system substrate-binding protein